MAVFALAMLASFWEDRAQPAAAFWFAVAGGLGYFAAALLLNRTRLRVWGDALIVDARPLPWRTKRVPVALIAELMVRPLPAVETLDAVSFLLVAVLKDGQAIALTAGFTRGHDYRLLERLAAELAQHLGVPLNAAR